MGEGGRVRVRGWGSVCVRGCVLGSLKEERRRPRRVKDYTFVVTSASRRAETKMAPAGQSRGSGVFTSLVRVSPGPGAGGPLGAKAAHLRPIMRITGQSPGVAMGREPQPSRMGCKNVPDRVAVSNLLLLPPTPEGERWGRGAAPFRPGNGRVTSSTWRGDLP